ncbi:MAG: aminopeptidase [Anaerolineae bacterium]|nr:aminopeptidase [Anaerolineae bacterium]
MYEDLASRMAHVITTYCVPIQPDQLVLILTPVVAEPLALELHDAILRAGGHPYIVPQFTGQFERFITFADDAQLEYVNPVLKAAVEQIDVQIGIHAPHNTRSLNATDPAKLTRFQGSRRTIRELFWKRYAAQSLRWNVCAWPTEASAQQAEMGILAYTEFVYQACALDQPDPVTHWEAFRERQLALVAWFKGKQRCEVKGPGIELSFSFADRPWGSAHGVVNFPDGEIYASPVEDSVNGRVDFNYPTVYQGRELTGVSLTFEDGVVVAASARKGDAFLQAQLDIDAGARRLGEFAIGTNMGIQRFTGDTLFDEKIGGTIHMALGNSYPEVGGTNQSVIHWDMVHGMQDGGEIWIDGELFYRGGEFMVA